MENIKAEEEKYLGKVLDKLRLKIGYVDESIEDIDDEIQKMDEYYWENYNEFDEYGYENYDNSQNRQIKVNESEERLKEKNRYLKMMDSPYFARIDFIYEGEEEPESYYIGIGNFSESASSVPMVFDWRAPVSSLFYDYDKGPAKFTAPAGEMEGEISLKRQYKIKGGVLKYFFQSDINIDDDVLKKELSMNGSDRLKNIVTTIQREQNKIIRDKSSRMLVVQGSAGSGKTSIALHRVAYLLYNSRGNLKANNILILSPNNVFADYISHILPELNEENISEMEFDYFAARMLGKYGHCEDRYDEIERIIKGGDNKTSLYKQSKEFALDINGYVLNLEADIVSFRNVKFGKLEKTAEDIQTLFYEKFTDIPVLKRMEAIAEYAIDEVETLYDFSYDEGDVLIIKDKFQRLYETTDIKKIYFEMCHDLGVSLDLDISGQAEDTVIRYEDVFPMLYLKYQLLGSKAHRPVKHLIIDEMQDYSYIQYAIIEKIFKCPMTILGDRNQTIGDGQRDAVEIIKEVFGRDVTAVEMKKSYRQTVEIGSFAADIIGEKDIEFFDRHGRAPERHLAVSDKKMFEMIVEGLKSQILDREQETIAVLCYSEEEALQVYKELEPLVAEALPLVNFNYMDKETEKFKKGITVTTFYLAKGLEFDCVHIPYLDYRYLDSRFGRQAYYVSATRAMHELDMYKA